MGDLNAHLGSTENDSASACNSRGKKWLDLIESHSLCNISLSSLSSRPSYTYSSGGYFSTIDYVLGNYDAVGGISSLEGHPLNTSDHLPISCTLDFTYVRHPMPAAFPSQPLDWHLASKTGTTSQYGETCDAIVPPLLGKDYSESSTEEVNEDSKSMCKKITDAANSLIQIKKSGKLNDPTLSHLCWKSRCAFRRWKEAGRPRSGPDSDERKKCKREVKAYLNKCKARQERRQIQRRDELFQQNHPSRFRHQHRQKAACTKLFSQGSLITDTKDRLKCWADHFSPLGQSQCSSNEFLRKSHQSISELASESIHSCDNILDSEIDVEEVDFAIQHLKRNRAGGIDNVSPEHLKFSGPIFRKRLCHVYNCICQLEHIPQCFKDGVIVPVFKGKGKDPLLMKNYQGISLTSVLRRSLKSSLSAASHHCSRLQGSPRAPKLLTERESHALTQSLLDQIKWRQHILMFL